MSNIAVTLTPEVYALYVAADEAFIAGAKANGIPGSHVLIGLASLHETLANGYSEQLTKAMNDVMGEMKLAAMTPEGSA